MYATKAQRCIRSASLELLLRIRNGILIPHQRVRYASGGKSALPDWTWQESTPVRRTSLTPGVGNFVAREGKIAEEPPSTLFDSSSERGTHSRPAQEMPAEPSVTVGARKRRRDRHDRYMAWLTERMAEDKSLESKPDLERKEIYWKEVECHILPDEFMPVRLRRHKAQEEGSPGPRTFVVRRTSQGTVKPQFGEEHNLPPQPNLTARPDFMETSEKTSLASLRMRFRPLQETVKEVEASGAKPQDSRITYETPSQGTHQQITETQSLPPRLKSEAGLDDPDTSLDNLSPRERALQLQLARKEAEALKIKGKQVAFEQQYKHRCSWCGSPAHTRATCGLLEADIEDGLCHVADGTVFVGRPWEGGPPIFRIKGLGEGTPLRNRLPRNPRPHQPKVTIVGATGRPGQERPAPIRKIATEVSDPFSAPPEGLPQETQLEQTAWPTPKPAREASPVRYFSPLPVEKPEEIDEARLLPPKINPEYEIGENHEVLPIHKVPVDPGVRRDKLAFARDSAARRQEKREMRDEFDEEEMEDYPEEYQPEIEPPAPAQPEQIYHTDLPEFQIYDGTITSLKPSTLRSRAITPGIPFLIRHPGSPDLASLASSSGMPAISQWFNPPPSPYLTALQREEYSPFTSFLTSASNSQVVMPYEFLTPTIPTINDGNHDLLSSFIFPAHPSLARFTPPPGTLSSLLSSCLNYLSARPHLDQDIWYEAIANDTRRRLAFLEVKDGKPLTDIQWQTLRRWGPMFQKFNAFQVPMELLIKAAEPVEESGSTAPGLGGLYVAQAQLADLPQDLQAHLPLPKVLAELYAGEEGKTRAEADIYGSNLWMGTPPTFTPLHKDPNPNFFVQLRGQKVIKLLSPAQGQEVYARVHRRIAKEKGNDAGAVNGAIRGEEMMQGLERAELEKAVWTEDGSEESIGETVVLGPGDAVYIPKGWWHSVKSVREGLNASVNWWFR